MSVQCTTCAKLISSKKHLAEHERIHSGVKPFVCQTCPESFACKGNLVKHTNKKHLNKLQICSVCNRTFKTPSLLTRHKKNAQEPLQRKCTKCCSSFRTLTKLKSHLKKVHDDDADFKSLKIKIRKTYSINGMDLNGSKADEPNARTRRSSSGLTKRKRDTDSNMAAIADPLPKSTPAAKSSPTNIKRKKSKKVDTNPDEIRGMDEQLYQQQEQTKDVRGQQQEEGQLGGIKVANFSNNDSALNASTIEDGLSNNIVYENGFLLTRWRITKCPITIERFNSSNNCPDDFIKVLLKATLIDFLSGKNYPLNVKNILEVLSGGPEKEVGKFITALMIIDFLGNLSTADIGSLYEQSQCLDKDFKLIIEQLTIYIVQRRLLVQFSSDSVNSIPECLQAHISLDLAILLTSEIGGEMQFEEDNINVQTRQEMKSLLAISTVLDNLMFADLDNNKGTSFVDDSFSGIERARVWNGLKNEFMNALVECKRVNLFQVLLLSDLVKKIDTMPYFRVQSQDGNSCGQLEVHLHHGVLKAFCVNPPAPQDTFIKDASREDVETFINLLYRSSVGPTLYNPKITMGVYRIAEMLNIRNISDFLFREESSWNCLMENKENKKDLIHIMTNLRMDKNLDQIAQRFTSLFPEADRFKVLNGMSVPNVIYFLKRKSMQNFDQLDIYKMLIQWSFHRAGKDCLDEMKAKYEPDVFENFKLVRQVLRLLDMRQHYGRLVAQKYITLKDIQNARKIALCKGASKSTPPSDCWFPTDDYEDNDK